VTSRADAFPGCCCRQRDRPSGAERFLRILTRPPERPPQPDPVDVAMVSLLGRWRRQPCQAGRRPVHRNRLPEPAIVSPKEEPPPQPTRRRRSGAAADPRARRTRPQGFAARKSWSSRRLREAAHRAQSAGTVTATAEERPAPATRRVASGIAAPMCRRARTTPPGGGTTGARAIYRRCPRSQQSCDAPADAVAVVVFRVRPTQRAVEVREATDVRFSTRRCSRLQAVALLSGRTKGRSPRYSSCACRGAVR